MAEAVFRGLFALELAGGAAPANAALPPGRAGELAGQACEPVTDSRGTAAYKRHLAEELTVRSLRTAAERAHTGRTEL